MAPGSPWPPFRAPTLGLSNVTVASLLDVLRELRAEEGTG